MALLSIFGEIVMRVRLTRREPSRDKLAWWRRGGYEVAATYEDVFPSSRIPLFRLFAFVCVLMFYLGRDVFTQGRNAAPFPGVSFNPESHYLITLGS